MDNIDTTVARPKIYKNVTNDNVRKAKAGGETTLEVD